MLILNLHIQRFVFNIISMVFLQAVWISLLFIAYYARYVSITGP